MPIQNDPPPGYPPMPGQPPPSPPANAVTAETPLEKIAELQQELVGETEEQRMVTDGEILEADCELIGIKPITGPGKGDL